jgi:DNA-directed RNA polymerase subunit RPC12/RpoP
MTEEMFVCSECGKEVKIKQVNGNTEEVSCEECKTKIMALKDPLPRFICLGGCRGDTTIIPMNLNKKPEQCPKCQSVELFEKINNLLNGITK